uniref:ATP-dependent Clp protease proteolytic subunit n=1 Tax=Passiflora oerstedii TaxID=196582 RepID=A0A2Z5D654_PASOE|nr:Clp protease proteolytic subunit [Passiflora oerstedii]AXB37884.1 Clp protease proteolytic subunit [Passiflora oerstedii]
MPIGIPKIPEIPEIPDDFRYFQEEEEEEETGWVDLYNELYKKKQLFLFQEVNNEITNQLVNLMLHLDTDDVSKDFYLYINSPGGWILPGMSLYNTMATVESNVRTVCIGQAASMASFLLTAGEPGKRLAFPHAEIMMHQPHGHFSEEDDDDNDNNDDKDDNNDDMININYLREMKELMTIEQDIASIYALRTGKSLDVIIKDLQSDSFMSPTEAKDYGIVDYVARRER